MNSRERMMGAVERKKIDRCPIRENFWGTTLERWRKQGLSKDTDVEAQFGLEKMNTTIVDWSFQFPVKLIEDNDEYTIRVNNDGVKTKTLKKTASMLQMSEYSIVTKGDWEEKKSRFVFNESRVNTADAKANYEKTKDSAMQIFQQPVVGITKFLHCMGTENLLFSIGDDPEWIKEMVEATEKLALDALDYCLGAGIEYDAGHLQEDMGFSNGPFFSPAFYREVIFPSHKRYCDYVHRKGMKVMLHSCGDIRKLLPMIVEAGFDVLNPMETKAGMDIYQIKKDYGDRLTLWGGIDVRTICGGDLGKLHDEIKEKVTFAKQGGGYIFSSDHSIPENVPLETYKQMVEWGIEYGRY